MHDCYLLSIIFLATNIQIVSIVIGFALQFHTNHAPKNIKWFFKKLITFCVIIPTYTRHVRVTTVHFRLNETVQEFGVMTSLCKIFKHIFYSIGILGVRAKERATHHKKITQWLLIQDQVKVPFRCRRKSSKWHLEVWNFLDILQE